MRALVLREVGSLLVVEDRPTPEPGPGEVLIRLHAAALNRRDFWIQQGLYADIRVPVILGSDGAGVVDRLGAGVEASWQGKEVIINPGLKWGDDPRVQSADFEILGMPRDGTFAEYVRVPVEQVWERPAHLNWEEAAALPLAGLTAYRVLFTQGGLRSGERVLITGIGGGVATMALLFSLAVGAEVWVTSSSPAKIDRAVALGAAGGFLYTDRDWTEALLREAGNPHLIVDSAGGDGYRLLVDVAAPGGRIVNFGATRGNIREISPRQVFWKQLHLIGSTMGSPREFAAMVEFVGRQALKPVVDQVLSLEEANRALAAMSQSGQFGKLVLRTT